MDDKYQQEALWKWILVPFAFIFGMFGAPALVYLLVTINNWLWGFNFGGANLGAWFTEVIQMIAGAWAPVYWTGYMAPRKKRLVSFVAAILIFIIFPFGIFAGIDLGRYSGSFLLWKVVLCLIGIVTAAITMWIIVIDNEKGWD